VNDDELNKSLLLVQNALKNTIKDERGAWILDGNHTEQRNEYSISGVYENKLVSVYLDRTFVDDDTRWIIDYKSSPHSGPDMDTFLDMQQDRYRMQLEKYASLMTGLDNRSIRLGLYFPLNKGWREWEYLG
jgi:ATP-dependent exoDNAse (exonuclease V) beta subunit